MIPVRCKADAMPVIASDGRRFPPLSEDHPLAVIPCPVCDETLVGRVTVLVFCGIAPEDRKEGGWTNGGSVAVHATCAGVSEDRAA